LTLFGAPIFCDPATAMLAKIYSAAVYGVDAYEVEIELTALAAIRTSLSLGCQTRP
jgi:hypothetical protein